MNLLCEVMIKAKSLGLSNKNLRFVMAKSYSPYMEISNPYLNQEELDLLAEVEVNPYYRFYDIFKNFMHPDLTEYVKLRKNIFNLIFHQLAQNDILSGMTKETYHKKLLSRDLKMGAFGEEAKNAIELFDRHEQEMLFWGLLRQYRMGSSLDLFTEMIEAIISNCIVYQNNINSYEILIYIGLKNEKKLEEKISFIIDMFAEIIYHIEIYYEYHFGILGVEETMVIDEMSLY